MCRYLPCKCKSCILKISETLLYNFRMLKTKWEQYLNKLKWRIMPAGRMFKSFLCNLNSGLKLITNWVRLSEDLPHKPSLCAETVQLLSHPPTCGHRLEQHTSSVEFQPVKQTILKYTISFITVIYDLCALLYWLYTVFTWEKYCLRNNPKSYHCHNFMVKWFHSESHILILLKI